MEVPQPLLGLSLTLLQVPSCFLESELHPFYPGPYRFVVLSYMLSYTLLQASSSDTVNSRNSA
jgi:hypothetical protein